MIKKTKFRNFKQLIDNFDTKNPDFENLIPYLNRQTEEDFTGLDGKDIGKYNAIKTLWQLSQPDKPKSRSRVWKYSRGYVFLVQWTNSVLLRILAKKWIDNLKSSNYPLTSSSHPLNPSLLGRLESQFIDSLRSTIANIEEGFGRPTTHEYLQFLGYSQASLTEARGDVERALQDGLLKSVKGSGLKDLGIDLKLWNDWVKNPSNSTKILSFPLMKNKHGYKILKDIKGSDLTYEMFIELINKTDFLLRNLVESLEKKLDDERMYYKVDQARIKNNLKGYK